MCTKTTKRGYRIADCQNIHCLRLLFAKIDLKNAIPKDLDAGKKPIPKYSTATCKKAKIAQEVKVQVGLLRADGYGRLTKLKGRTIPVLFD